MTPPPIFYKSPLNYIGGKYKLLPQLFPLFPDNVDTFVDLFAGGGDVFINCDARRVIANDINHYIIGIYRAFQAYSLEEIVGRIEHLISEWELSSTNEDAYKRFRDHYNETKDPIELYVLVCHSFNYQFRFNARQEYNNPFGRNRSWLNPTLKKNLVRFIDRLQRVELYAENFKNFGLEMLGPDDFVYADPPYLITTGSYNDGKRGLEGWSAQDDILLYEKLSELNARNVRFALSNVIAHKGKANTILENWSRDFNIHYIEKHYNNSCYNSSNTDKPTVEVLITNY